MNAEPASPSTTPSHRRLLLGGIAALVVGVLAIGTFFVASASGGGHDPRNDPEGPGFQYHPQNPASPTADTSDLTAPTPTPSAPNAADANVAAAGADIALHYDATNDPTLCAAVPRSTNCFSHVEGVDSPERGIVQFHITFINGTTDDFDYGRDQNGAWQIWYFPKWGQYHATILPAQLRVCADGEGANVRNAPSTTAQSLGTLNDNELVTAQQFILVRPGAQIDYDREGWYEVTGALNGYIRADLLSVTTLPDCSLRNSLVHGN